MRAVAAFAIGGDRRARQSAHRRRAPAAGSNEVRRTTYLLTVRPEPGVDEIRALRAWLKIGLRTFGLRCVGITPREKEKVMDARKYASKYVKPDNVRDGPIQTRIVNVFEEDATAVVLELETGSQFALNEGNTNVLIKAWGHDTNGWIGEERRSRSSLGLIRIGTKIRRRKKKRSGSVSSRREKQPPRTGARRRASRRCRRAGRSPPRMRWMTKFRFDDGVLPWPILRPSRTGSPSAFACLAPPSERMPAP